MDADDSKFSNAEVELRQLIDDVTRAMTRAQAAIAKVTNRQAADAAAPAAPAMPAREMSAPEMAAPEAPAAA
ncbi:MAG: hypothetical protein HZA68_11625 [Rhodovulum sp.]|nr:hypothetical protein [Rhodovulum sp.]